MIVQKNKNVFKIVICCLKPIIVNLFWNLFMKKIVYLSIMLLFLILDSVKSYEHWIREDWKLLPVIHVDGLYGLTSSYCDLFFIDSLNGLMSQSGGVSGPHISKTTDGGYSWNYELRDTIIWKDGKHEFVPAKPLSLHVKNGLSVLGTVNQTTFLKTFSIDSGMVLISIDTGSTWQKKYTGLKTGINDVRVLKNGTIIVMANNYTAKSLDTGKTWIKSSQFPDKVNDSTLWINPYDSTANITTQWYPNFLDCQDENNFYVFAISNQFPKLNNRFIFTSDGGQSWNYKEFPRQKLSDFAVTSDKKLWITGGYKRNDTGMPYIYVDYSTDNGDTWNNSLDTIFPERGSLDPVSRVKFYDSLNGAIVGNYGIFMRTADGGRSWHDEIRKGIKPDTMIYGSFTNFQYKTKDTIVLYDYGNIFFPRLIIAPLLKIPTDIAEFINLDNEFKVYPNPTSDFITIQFQTSEVLQTSEVSKVQIFDMLGIEIKDLTPALSKGEGVRIDVSKLPAGVYFIRIGTRVEKFVKM